EPKAFVGYVCNKRTVDILRNNPDIDQVYVYEKDDFATMWRISKIKFFKAVMDFVRQIKKEQYGLTIDVSLNKYVGFLTLLAGIKRRIGFDYKGRGLWLTKKIKLAGYESKHVIDFYLDLLGQMAIPVKEKSIKLLIKPDDQKWAEDFLLAEGVTSADKLVALVPGGGASWGKDADYKRWPVENYSKLADKVIEKSHAKIILIGDRLEANVCQDVAAKMISPCIKVLGKATVGQFAALVSKCRLAIVNDGGPLHVAVGLGVRTVSIFGPVDEIVYGPYPKNHHEVVTSKIPCRPCYRRFHVADCKHRKCLRSISVDDVIAKIGEIL
ncbi:MAG: glycosyltransferase family 9 protein, partial [Candidatus Omnitrophica bacterium]|nr:glycosyltransferase family 9 protein [Candidatus Omnitrophota bacterium]